MMLINVLFQNTIMAVGRTENAVKLTVQDCGGRDFLSRPILLSEDGNYVFANETDKVTIFSAQTGIPVKTIFTGEIFCMSLTGTAGQIAVAGRKSVTVWDYELTKVVTKHKYFKKEFARKFNYEAVIDVFLPNNFGSSGDVYLTVVDKKNMNNFLRVNVLEVTCNQIFKNVSPGTQHVGDKNNSIVTLANHKIHGFKNNSVLCYDRNLSKVQGFNTDRERPFTIVRCHPEEKTLACGDESGRILLFSGLENRDELRAAKSILHWHTLPVTALSWSLEGGHIYSGGGERVLCKWLPDCAKPTFLPRLSSSILGIEVSETSTAVKLANNSVLILGREDKPSGELVGLSRNSSGWPAGLAWDERSKSLLLNGIVGHVQVFHPDSKDTQSIDITQQNYLTEEREKNPFNAEVDKLAVSGCGMFLSTMDCCWTPVERLNLKFWHYDQSCHRFILNTQVDTPHKGGVCSLRFQNVGSDEDTPCLLSCGNDGKAKVWHLLTSTWECKYSLDFRGLDCVGGAWSADGSVLGLCFSHVITLWDKEARLRTTLTLDDKKEPVACLEFGKGVKHGSLLFAATNGTLGIWDLLTLGRIWSVSLQGETLNLVSDPSAGHLAVITKDLITIVDPLQKTEVGTFVGVNTTGGAVYAKYRNQSYLFFLTYSGLIKCIGSKIKRKPVLDSKISLKASNPFLTNRTSTVSPMEISAEVRQPISEDLGSILSAPLHAIPSNSALAPSFLCNRILSLPKTQARSAFPNVEETKSESSNEIRKIKQVFHREVKPTNLEFDVFCKLFKSENIK